MDIHNKLVDIVLIIAGASWAVQLFYYLYFYAATGFAKIPRKKNRDIPVSVIICARNEEHNLRQFLPLILTQDYPDYEVIVVNDASTDGTEELLESFAGKYKHLRYSTITKDNRFSHGKKLAVLVGTKAAKNEWLLFTDADCRPATGQWIRLMARNFTKKTSIVLGYGGFIPGKGLLNHFIRYESFFIAIQYLGFALRSRPYMGVGRNMAYRKPLYYEISKQKYFVSLASGDDDLLVNRLADKTNTRVETDARARTLSVSSPSWKQWFRNKKRHITTSKYYTPRSKWLLSGEMSSRVLFLSASAFLFFLPVSWTLPTIALVIRWSVMGIIFGKAEKRLEEKQLLLSSFFYDIIIPFLYFFIWISNLSRTNKISWE